MKNKNKIKAAIFDMDGLILDSEILNSQSIEILIKRYGKKPIYNNLGIIHEVGKSGDEGYLAFMKQHNIEDALTKVKKRKRTILTKLIKEKKLKTFPGFNRLIASLKKKGVKTALATNRRLFHVTLILENLGIKDKFDVIVGPNKKRLHKPAPDIYLAALKKLKAKPEEAFVFEDSETGVISAAKAGIKVIAVPNIYTKHHDFSLATKTVASLKDINVKLLQSL